jgi:hypothetical protein
MFSPENPYQRWASAKERIYPANQHIFTTAAHIVHYAVERTL